MVIILCLSHSYTRIHGNIQGRVLANQHSNCYIAMVSVYINFYLEMHTMFFTMAVDDVLPFVTYFATLAARDRNKIN